MKDSNSHYDSCVKKKKTRLKSTKNAGMIQPSVRAGNATNFSMIYPIWFRGFLGVV